MKPYKIIGAYDSETTNLTRNGETVAFPILHQLGLSDVDVLDIDENNVTDVVKIELYRHTLDLYARLDELCSPRAYVPVIMCHNLSFDMYGLSGWLERHDVRVLAKSPRKPITFTVRDKKGEPALVIWDTLIFSQQSLERMGNDCRYSKGVGEWDYDLIRTPATPLTDEEIDYAKRDIYTLFVWLGWWLRRNLDIAPDRLGLNVVTKTGVVRERRRVRFDSIKGRKNKYNVGRYWLYRCRTEAPKNDDELFTMFAATRGGLTFCSSRNASVPFNLVGTDRVVSAYDATSQHPAQLVSHMYPVGFQEHSAEVLGLAFDLIGKITMERVLNCWDKPFPVAFYACFEFTNLRPKPGTVFEKMGVLPLASARYHTAGQTALSDDNGDKAAYEEHYQQRGYCDTATGATCAFGKLVSADTARVYITELTAWEMWQCYTWDSVIAVHGYSTGKFTRPSDMDVISVMQFYKAKDQFKIARESYYRTGTISNGDMLKTLGVASAIVEAMENGSCPEGDVEATYLALKADLNSIFGISCSNEYRRDTVLTAAGIGYEGDFGLVNRPKNPKVWYQFGQRIVGWSRIAQIVAISLVMPYCHELVNGDTDSIKVVCDRDALPAIEMALSCLGSAIDKGKERVCARVKYAYPPYYDNLKSIGHYVHEFTSERFCASWNKAYVTHDAGRDGERHFSFTLAGIPTRWRVGKVSCFIGINGYADRLYKLGWSFEDICNTFLGYNVTYAYDIIKLNGRSFPGWGDMTFEDVTDYNGETARVVEPCALALFPMSKTVNDTSSPENRDNLAYAMRNNPDVNTAHKLVCANGIIDMHELLQGVFNG